MIHLTKRTVVKMVSCSWRLTASLANTQFFEHYVLLAVTWERISYAEMMPIGVISMNLLNTPKSNSIRKWWFNLFNLIAEYQYAAICKCKWRLVKCTRFFARTIYSVEEKKPFSCRIICSFHFVNEKIHWLNMISYAPKTKKL